MSIPVELQNKKLVDSRWRRRVGKHKGVQCKIIKINGSGVVLEFDTRNRHGWQGHGENNERTNLPWEMFLRLYEPMGVIMENVPNVKVDTSGIVVAKSGDVSYMEKKVPSPSFRQCNGPSHHVRPANVDVARFGYTERLYNGVRRLRSECDDCVRYRNEHYRAKDKEERKLRVVEEPKSIEPTSQVELDRQFETKRDRESVPEIESVPENSYKVRTPRWKVTIRRTQEVSDLELAELLMDDDVLTIEKL